MDIKKCVYVIGNKSLKRCYVGETNNIHRRISQHMDLLISGKHYSKSMQMDYDKYDTLDAINILDCNERTKQERKILEKIVMLIYLKNGWQLYNSNPIPNKSNLEWHIMYYLLEDTKNHLVGDI